jgi:hypothetical protein
MASRVHVMDEDHDYEKLATPAEKRRWAKQNNLMYGGLIAISVVILQGFLGASSPGVSGRVSVVAFAVALPLLAVLILLGELHPGGPTRSTVTYEVTKAVAMVSSIVGVVAAFWHVDWLAGVALLAAGTAGLAVYSAHFGASRSGRAALRRKAGGAPKDGGTGSL